MVHSTFFPPEKGKKTAILSIFEILIFKKKESSLLRPPSQYLFKNPFGIYFFPTYKSCSSLALAIQRGFFLSINLGSTFGIFTIVPGVILSG